ncbi:MAG: hypothetical protein Ta2B_07720 [Termitinemataceae bacterium]|nr:MAG: hypothetical protein Ta2B_07720 [Termitinemataceae bacterium]
MSDMDTSKKNLTKRGIDAVLGIAGGVALSFLGFFVSRMFPPLGLVLGIVVTLLGVSGIISKNKDDRKNGALTTVVGAILILSFLKVVPVIAALAGTLLSICAFISFGFGIWNGIRFLFGLRKIS